MKASHLTPNGIESMFKGESVIIQVIEGTPQNTSAVETEEFLQYLFTHVGPLSAMASVLSAKLGSP